MKKLYALLLGTVLVLCLASVSLAVTIKTSGEVDFGYFTKHWTGEDAGYTMTEIGLYNNIDIDEKVSAYIGFWLETNGKATQEYNIVDDAYVTYKFDAGSSFTVGYNRFSTNGPTDALADFTRGLFGGSLEPAVNLIYTAQLSDAWTIQAGYFHNWQGNSYDDVSNTGRNAFLTKGTFSAGNFTGNIMYLLPGKNEWDSVEPAGEYMIDGTLKAGKFTVYAAYIGVDQGLDNNKPTGYSVDETDNFGIIGATASLGNLWMSVDYAILTPDDTNVWVDYQDGSWHEVKWSEDKPFGFNLAYYLGHNSTLKYTYATNTGNWSDYSRLRLIVKF